MLPEIGHFALVLALCVAVVQGILPLVGVARGIPGWIALARPAAWAQFLMLATAFALLAQAFLANDFSVAYVAQNSNSALPAAFRFSAIWGGHEGSMLLWILMLGGWGAAVAAFSRRLPPEMVARVLAIMGLVGVGFLLFLLLTSNPFERLVTPPADGRDLNPLLQDVGLIVHPPTLYMGYVGFSVAFAFALAALLGGRLDAAWARWSRPWTVVAWAFLGLGIVLGSWWAYYELGWGGWWFWDPVENASFLPWLAGTALIHSLAVAEKRAAFKTWTVLLAIFAFALSLLGTFLVRSGVLTSVHAFANDPERGVFILMLLAVVVGASLFIYAWRAPAVHSSGRFALFSRETLLLGNNVLLVVATATVLLGTIYPLILDALAMGKISVGPPYFNAVFLPLMTPVVFVMGIGPLVRWKNDTPGRLVPLLRLAFIGALVLGVAVPVLAYDGFAPLVALGIGLAAWVLFTTLVDLRQRTRTRGVVEGVRRLSRSWWGMTLAHLGVAVTIVGITLTTHYSVERDVRVAPGEVIEVGGLDFAFEDLGMREGPNYTAAVATVRVTREGEPVTVLETEKRMYRVRTMPMTEVGLDPGLFRDLYVAIGDQLDGETWAMRVYYKPFIRWIWLGGLLMSIGGVVAVADRRYRLARRSEATVPAAAQPQE